jgi:hypothetical protein
VRTPIAVCLVLLAAAAALPRLPSDDSPTSSTGDIGRAISLWYDDADSGEGGWTHGDNTATATPNFHVATYNAWPGGQYSYWCGRLDESYTGGDGYGNGWDERLELPPISLGDVGDTAPPFPVLTYRYRYDSEPTYDFTYVQAESTGSYVNLNRGYDGSSDGWQDLGIFGFILTGYDHPLKVRFRFISDAAYSDEDAVYDSDAGAFHVDDIQVFDYVGGQTHFFDDVEDGFGLCIPAVPPSAGDYWHIVERRCPAASDPYCWWCGDDADTTLIPPGLDNWLMSPVIDLSGALATTLRFLLHAEVPQVDDDYWTEEVTLDGGGTWYHSGTYWGDYESCSGWSARALFWGIDLTPYLTGDDDRFAFRLTFHTTDNGCGPGLAGGAGIMLDDISLEGYDTPVREGTWGAIKGLFR